MLLIIVIFVIGLALLFNGIMMYRKSEWLDYEAYITPGIVLLILALIVGCIAWHENAFKDATLESYRMKREALVTQIDENYYNKFTYDGRENLIKEIVNYNDTVIKSRAKHKSKWIGALYPEDWESLELIDIGGMKND